MEESDDRPIAGSQASSPGATDVEGASTGHGGVGSAVTTAVVAAQMMPAVAPAPSRTAYPTLSGGSSVAQSVHSGPAHAPVRARGTAEELAKGTEKVKRLNSQVGDDASTFRSA